jgi:hypothetical protein
LDRFVEIDCDVFGSPPRKENIAKVLTGLRPLLQAPSNSSEVGLVMNFGWVLDLVVLWSGNPRQLLPINSKRLSPWSQISYQDLRDFLFQLKESASDQGIRNLRLGPLFIGVGEFATDIVNGSEEETGGDDSGAIYQERSQWLRRHPELFPFSEKVTLHGKGIDLRVFLSQDDNEYAAYQKGITKGTSFADFFSNQWASLAEYLGFSLLLLRDEFTTPVHAGRIDFDGGTGPATKAEVDEWTEAVALLTTKIKSAAPSTWLMLYSSGLSPSVDYHFGRLDTQKLVKKGSFDGWIEQTWGGAWQDWWDAGFAGWTFQLSHLASRIGLIKSTKKPFSLGTPKVYKLVQLLDGWEPYDTFRDYPGKLRWGIWAFSHASYQDEFDQLHHSDGTYFAIANDSNGELITRDEAEWVAIEVTQAEKSANKVTARLGYKLPVSTVRDVPDGAPVFIEETIALLMKWGFLFAGTASSDARLDNESIVVPAESRLAANQRLFVGRPQDLSIEMKKRFQISESTKFEPPGYKTVRTKMARMRGKFWPYLYGHVETESPISAMSATSSPLLIKSGSDVLLFPPDLANPLDRRVTHYQLGAIEPFVGAVHLLNNSEQGAGLPNPGLGAVHETVSIAAWIESSQLCILFGNVESGWMGDSRFPRTVSVTFPKELSQFQKLTPDSDPADVDVFEGDKVTVTVTVKPESMALVRIGRA